MSSIKILWADDEIELLKPHIIFLERKGYEVCAVNSGEDAIEECSREHFDAVFLDENMPGRSGLETLVEIKKLAPATPVVMITKSEAEDLMEQAIGRNIADYLIKPVNPSQILMAIKKVVQSKDIISSYAATSFRTRFMEMSSRIGSARSADDFRELYKDLVLWEMELPAGEDGIREMCQSLKDEANAAFAKFIKKNYAGWVAPGAAPADRPLLSPYVFKSRVLPLLDEGRSVFFVLIDNLRLDQWRVIQKELSPLFSFASDEIFFSILPTSTQYSRNAIFSGLMPAAIRKMYPQYWVDEEEDEGKNLNEEALIGTQLERFRKKYGYSYNKINTNAAASKLNESLPSLMGNKLNVVVFNFVDMLSHARTEVKLFRELAPDEAAYRSLVHSWFVHSAVSDFFALLAKNKAAVVLATDHGSIRVRKPVKVVGDKNTNVNLRYKVGKNLAYDKKAVYAITSPEQAGLPCPNVSSAYIFASEDDFFAYPNNFNYYASYYRDTFQHGGISMEEMMIPLVVMNPKA